MTAMSKNIPYFTTQVNNVRIKEADHLKPKLIFILSACCPPQ